MTTNKRMGDKVWLLDKNEIVQGEIYYIKCGIKVRKNEMVDNINIQKVFSSKKELVESLYK